MFFDTNVLFYLLTGPAEKSAIAERLISQGGVISVQTLNEFISTGRRKKIPWLTLEDALHRFRQRFRVEPLTLDIHDLGMVIAQRYKFHIYDSLLLAAALNAGCTAFFTEDMQHGQVIEDRLTIANPFV